MIALYEEEHLAQGFFRNREELARYVSHMEELHRDPTRKDLRWQLGIDDDVLSVDIRQREFSNWIHRLVIPRAAQSQAEEKQQA